MLQSRSCPPDHFTPKNHSAIICVRMLTFSIFHPRTPGSCLTLSLRSTVIKLRLPNKQQLCFLLIVITFLSLLSCTSICKSQLHFVSCGVFTQLNEDSDSEYVKEEGLHEDNNMCCSTAMLNVTK